jgi:hypothetical protein
VGVNPDEEANYHSSNNPERYLPLWIVPHPRIRMPDSPGFIQGSRNSCTTFVALLGRLPFGRQRRYSPKNNPVLSLGCPHCGKSFGFGPADGPANVRRDASWGMIERCSICANASRFDKGDYSSSSTRARPKGRSQAELYSQSFLPVHALCSIRSRATPNASRNSCAPNTRRASCSTIQSHSRRSWSFGQRSQTSLSSLTLHGSPKRTT